MSASKRFTIHRASNVLTISLKRFGSCGSSGGRKITKVSAQQSTARAVSWPKVLPPEQDRRWSWCSPAAIPHCSPRGKLGSSWHHLCRNLCLGRARPREREMGLIAQQSCSCSHKKAMPAPETSPFHRTWDTLSSWTSALTCLSPRAILSHMDSMQCWCTLGTAATQGTTSAT